MLNGELSDITRCFILFYRYTCTKKFFCFLQIFQCYVFFYRLVVFQSFQQISYKIYRDRSIFIQIFLKKDSVFFLQTMLWFSSCIPVNFINLIRIHPNLLYEMSLLMVLPDYSYHIFIFQCIHQNMNFFIFWWTLIIICRYRCSRKTKLYLYLSPVLSNWQQTVFIGIQQMI